MSTTATGLPPNVEVYLAALRDELADLAPEERDDLLSEVEPSLLEAAADGDDPIAARLGPAADFAADLRASAGLPPAPKAPAQRPGLRAALAQLAAASRARWALARARELAPVWWAARAYVAVAAVALLLGSEWSAQWPALPRFASAEATAVVFMAALAGSLALGIATRGVASQALRRGATGLNVVLVLALPAVVDQATEAPWTPPPFDGYAAPSPQDPVIGLSYDGVALDNVYAYDRRGRLLYDVRLFGADGRPLEFGRGFDNQDRRAVYDEQGKEVFNAFPVRYFEPGTNRVARPAAGAPPAPAPLSTKPPRRLRSTNER